MNQNIKTTITLLIVWIILFENISIYCILSGITTCAMLTIAMNKIIKISKKIFKSHRMGLHIKITSYLFFYIPWLIWQVIVSSINVAKIVWNKIEVHPSMIHTKPNTRTNFGIMILANSITLTPGTISVSEEGSKKITIHALNTKHNEAEDGINQINTKVNKLIKGVNKITNKSKL